MNEIELLAKMRKQIFLMAYSAGIGHLASAYSCLEIIYTLYFKNIMNANPQNISLVDHDKFILSKGHGSLALYHILAIKGFFDESELMTFSRPYSRMGGEPNVLELPGVEASTGSLGHGLSIAVGRALADKMDANNNKTFVLLGDGECQEGSIWEAVMSAQKFHLDNLYIIIDNNKMQKMGYITEIMNIDEWTTKFQSFGCNVVNVSGHNISELENCFNSLINNGKPHVIIANTIKGKGVTIMENNPSWHWRLPSKKELKIVLKELNISQEEIEHAKSLRTNTL